MSSRNRSWSALVDDFARKSRHSKSLAAARNTFVAGARLILKLPLVRRVYRYDDIGRYRTWLDGRAVPLKEPMRTIFALAMSDHGTNSILASELPVLAAAARLTGDRVFYKRICEQLHEVAAWSPLQRPGWCAFGDRLPPDGKDGNWLATGTGIRAIADAMEIMGRENLPAATVARLDQLLAAEIVSIADDWHAKRPWFIQHKTPLTNQWVLPTEGLIRACLVLGRDRHHVAYELGVANLAAHLDAHGAQGAFEEGIHYAAFTITSVLAAARAMALDGDRRAWNHPFLQRFPLWALHHIQPGGFFINAFDAFFAARGGGEPLHKMLGMLAVCLDNPAAAWGRTLIKAKPDTTLTGLLAQLHDQVPRRHSPPRPYASYTRAMRINWRSDWADNATGVWIRGGDKHDSHDHIDRGHVNFILHGKPVFIEAGTPAYHNPLMRLEYASGHGHNVLQIGTLAAPRKDIRGYIVQRGWQKPHAIAPITVKRLDARGGDISLDGTAGYEGLAQWERCARWNSLQLHVTDNVTLEPGKPQVVLFRWHLGTTRPPHVLASKSGAFVSWAGVRLRIEGSCPLRINTEMMPDHTLRYRPWDDKRPDNLHVCLVVQTATKVERSTIQLSAAAI